MKFERPDTAVRAAFHDDLAAEPDGEVDCQLRVIGHRAPELLVVRADAAEVQPGKPQAVGVELPGEVGRLHLAKVAVRVEQLRRKREQLDRREAALRGLAQQVVQRIMPPATG